MIPKKLFKNPSFSVGERGVGRGVVCVGPQPAAAAAQRRAGVAVAQRTRHGQLGRHAASQVTCPILNTYYTS